MIKGKSDLVGYFSPIWQLIYVHIWIWAQYKWKLSLSASCHRSVNAAQINVPKDHLLHVQVPQRRWRQWRLQHWVCVWEGPGLLSGLTDNFSSLITRVKWVNHPTLNLQTTCEITLLFIFLPVHRGVYSSKVWGQRLSLLDSCIIGEKKYSPFFKLCLYYYCFVMSRASWWWRLFISLPLLWLSLERHQSAMMSSSQSAVMPILHLDLSLHLETQICLLCAWQVM